MREEGRKGGGDRCGEVTDESNRHKVNCVAKLKKI